MARDKQFVQSALIRATVETFRRVKDIKSECSVFFRDVKTVEAQLEGLCDLGFAERGWNHGIGEWLYRLTPLGAERRAELIQQMNATGNLAFA